MCSCHCVNSQPGCWQCGGRVRHCWATQDIFVRRWIGVRQGRIHQATVLIQQIVYLLHQHLHVCVCVCVCACVHMRLTLCNPIDCSPSGSSVHGVFQARKLKCFAVSYSRGSSKPRDQSWVSLSPALAGDSLPLVPPGKPTVHKRQSLWGKG